MPHGPLNSTSDEQLASRAQTGCVESFSELVRRFQVPLKHYLRRTVACDADADDLTQETFLRAFRKLGYYRPDWAFSTWLFTLAHRVGLNQRRRRPAVLSAELGPLSSSEPSPGEAALRRESREGLWDLAAEVLPAEQFTALWLFYVEDKPVREIARVVGRSESAVKTGLFRARKKLLPHVQEETAESRSAARPGGPSRPISPATPEVSYG